MSAHVGIVGGGYAGLCAAVELARNGVAVTVFESSRTLGGRARVVEKDDRRIDNGQHILIGAYTETLRMLRALGVSAKQLTRIPFEVEIPGRLSFRAADLPAPFNLAIGLWSAKQLTWADRFAAIGLLRFVKRHRKGLSEDFSVSELLSRTQQTATLQQLIWEPLCVAALNTPANEASAQVFINVLHDALCAGAAASEFLIPRCDLSELLPVPATLFLSRAGHAVHTAAAIKQVLKHEEGFQLVGDAYENRRFSHVIVATGPYHVSALLAGFDELALLRQQIDGMPHEPITTVYLAYDEHIRLSRPILGMADSIVQWLFDRGQLGGPAGMIACVISARGPHSDLSREEIGLRAHQALEALIPRLPAPKWSTVITEKRATFACRPGVVRPLGITPVKNLYLAGDYVASAYPGTIEAAVRSGLAAARQILRTERQQTRSLASSTLA